jgi:hypothetical protein
MQEGMDGKRASRYPIGIVLVVYATHGSRILISLRTKIKFDRHLLLIVLNPTDEALLDFVNLAISYLKLETDIE